ncbi:MAG TPA: cupredoxin domain-containing protein [Actinomycetota bacterium]
MSQDLNERVEEVEEDPRPRLPPVAYPLLALIFGGIIVWSFSRILLAVSANAAVIVATLAALNILIGAALVAYGRRVRGRSVAFPILIGAGIAVVAAGFVTWAVVGERAPEEEAAGPKGGGPAQSVTLTAKELKFVETKLTFKAESKVSLRVVNQDQGVPHNFVLFNGEDESGSQIFRGQVVTGPTTATYSFTAPGPGSYFFHCEVHPTTMKGTAIVGGAGGAPEPGDGSSSPGTAPGQGGTTAGAVPLEAKNISFVEKQLSVAAGGQVAVKFTNSDNGVPHNFAVYEDKSATKVLFRSDPFPGPATKTLTFKAPSPGSYFFRCDIHPTQMSGTFVVT